MKRQEIDAQIALLESMADISTAIDDVESVEWEPGDAHVFQLNVLARDPVSFVHGIPPEVLLAGLRAMDAALDEAVRRLQGEAE